MLQNKNRLLTILLLISIYFTTIVYSAFDTRLQIEGDAVVRTDQSIRITNLELTNRTNDAYEEYNSKFGKDTTSMYLILPASSSITYTVEITNKVSDSYLIDSIDEISNTNNNIGIDLSLNVNDIVNGNSTKTFTITLTNSTDSEQHETLVIEYGFKLNSFTVSFDANGGSVGTQSKTVSYGSNYGTLPTPTKAGYKFLGWNGKNLFDRNKAIDDKVLRWATGIPGDDEGSITSDYIAVKKGITYISKYLMQIILYDENKNYIGVYDNYNVERKNFVIDDSNNAYYVRICFRKLFDVNMTTVEDLQLEENTIPTSYEPYYITASTTVVQPKNHTLTAIWEPNTYDIFYQGIGATQLNNSNLVAKYDGYYNDIYEHSNDITTWKDFSGNGHNGTMSGDVSWGSDFLNFNGGGVFLGQMNNDYATLEVTFSQDEVQSSGGKALIANWETNGIGIRLIDGYIGSATRLSNSYEYIYVDSDVKVEAGKKYHVALTFDGTSIKLYVNGILSNSVNNLNGTIGVANDSTAMAIGVNPYRSAGIETDSQFIGKIYNAAIYNTALSAEQIAIDAGKKVTYDDVYGILPTPERVGYTFDGWYLDTSFTVRVTEKTKVLTANNHFLYAKWIPYKEEYSTPNSYEFTAPYSGIYKIELWGAQGGYTTIPKNLFGGLGGYTSGIISLNSNSKLFVYVGENGFDNIGQVQNTYNGGGQGSTERFKSAGGGATDVRLVGGAWSDFDSLKNRIMVSGGGGGSSHYGTGGYAGGLSGSDGIPFGNEGQVLPGTGGTQTSGGNHGPYETSNEYYATNWIGGEDGKFGFGGKSNPDYGGGGGSGYYGGGGANLVSRGRSAGGGGSSFISGYSGCNAIDESSTEDNIIHTNQPNHYSGKVFTNSVMIDGAGCDWSTGSATNCGANQPQPDGTNATGHIGNGYARITYIG